MVGLGKKEDYMYKFVTASEVKPYRDVCSEVLWDACAILLDKGISAQFTLIGSGAKNFVTRDGNASYDLDYNLEIVKAPDNYWGNLQYLKDTVRRALDRASGTNRFRFGQDSTSVITVQLPSNNGFQPKFSFDVAIIMKEDGKTYRLQHDKNAYGLGCDQYIWNEIPNSANITEKADKIKKAGRWDLVRERYLDLKNQYLRNGDRSHPSYVVFVEAVNEIYSKIRR